VLATNSSGQVTQVLQPGATLRLRFATGNAAALELELRPLRLGPHAESLHLLIKAQDATSASTIDAPCPLGGRLVVPLPELRAPVELAITPAADSLPVLILPGDVRLLGRLCRLDELGGTLLLGFLVLSLLPAGLATLLGLQLRGGLAFVLASMMAALATFAPFFRDAIRYLAGDHAHGSPLPSAAARMIARGLLRILPDLSPWRPSVLWREPGLTAASHGAMWLTVAVVLVGVVTVRMRREAES
jgi:hypothetical protein